MKCQLEQQVKQLSCRNLKPKCLYSIMFCFKELEISNLSIISRTGILSTVIIQKVILTHIKRDFVCRSKEQSDHKKQHEADEDLEEAIVTWAEALLIPYILHSHVFI